MEPDLRGGFSCCTHERRKFAFDVVACPSALTEEGLYRGFCVPMFRNVPVNTGLDHGHHLGIYERKNHRIDIPMEPVPVEKEAEIIGVAFGEMAFLEFFFPIADLFVNPLDACVDLAAREPSGPEVLVDTKHPHVDRFECIPTNRPVLNGQAWSDSQVERGNRKKNGYVLGSTELAFDDDIERRRNDPTEAPAIGTCPRMDEFYLRRGRKGYAGKEFQRTKVSELEAGRVAYAFKV